MGLIEDVRSELSTLAESYPKGATLIDLASYFGVPLRQIEPVVNALEGEGALAFKGDKLLFDGSETARSKARTRDTTRSRLRPEHYKVNNKTWAYGVHPNRIEVTAPEARAQEMRPGLERLAKAFPYGATAAQMADFFRMTPEHVYSAIRALEASGDGVWEKTRDGKGGNIFFVEGMLQAPPALTENQERVYAAICKIAHNGRATVKYAQIVKDTGIVQGSIIQICYALEVKRYIKRLTPYDREGVRTSPEYEVYSPEPRKPNIPRKRQDALPASPGVAPEISARICDEAAIKRALARREECVEEIKRIDDFLALYGEFGVE